ncbi:hypothetical protein AKJ37_03060 [candidate division MSBL1 archaeon SCGC-AAA259I09]|uniref:Uncharacterized protein n=3 Tax=candidate division MSBL1 TaxID=215777 RepID=A0A133UT48_9EURY|nr:hypothetical protein AKJ62_02530 [candidate division MSBL1 archaeon SCGC-AAA259D14]KXA93810.1 hypothetical protein AKJ66_00875 [candidate division MSBL1 archaeon SCGC-AAA259E22]KXA97414.1 hypothetical protein AKJ37_03060 [candidate division MSBL1 archaeon SCGC-AAA259I09]
METGSIVVYLFSEKPETGEISSGEKIPEKIMANLEKYSLVIPINQYEKLGEEAKRDGLTIQEEIFSKYRYITEIPEEWEVIPLT